MRTATRIETRKLGNTGLEVTVIGLGAAQLGLQGPTLEEAGRVLNTMLDEGLRLIDTASSYGQSEEYIGETVSHRRDEFVLTSKCGDSKDIQIENFDPHKVELEIDRSLRRLKTDVIDVMFLHTCEKAELEKGDVIAPLQTAKEAGKVRFIGYSGDNEAAEYAIECSSFDALEISVNIADQRAIDMDLLDKAKAKGMGVLAKRSIANTCWRPEPNELQDISPYQKRLLQLDFEWLNDQDVSETAKRFLRWCIATPGVDSALVGLRSVDHWRDIREAAEEGPLAKEEWESIRRRWTEVSQVDWKGIG